MLLTVIGVIVRSIFVRNNGVVRSIGARLIQFTCVALIIPAIIILGVLKLLSGETIATIIGGLIGYVLSNVGDYGKEKKGE
jgi:hypothetical protein